ncbi:MAG: diguanylate cyclase, partial [bacterium]|nr:diguanylate cyclase [bacterium]
MTAVDKTSALATELYVELSHAAQWLNSTLHRSEVIRGILEKGTALAGSEGSCLVLVDDARKEGREVHCRGIGDDLLRSFLARYVDELNDLADSEGVVRIEPVPGGEASGIHSLLAFPFVLGSTMAGTLCFFNPSLPADHVEVLKHFVKHGASALENARRYEEKDRQTRQLNILNESTLALSAEPRLEALYQKVCEHARYLIRSDAAMFIVLGADAARVEAVYCAGELEPEPLHPETRISPTLVEICDSQGLLSGRGDNAENGAPLLPVTVPGLGHFLALPMIQENSVGILVLMNGDRGKLFCKEDEDLLMSYSIQTALAIDNAILHQRTKRLAITDGLTQVLNHREFQNKLEAEVRRCIRYRRIFSLLMIDIDHFKIFNDTFGHPVGDKVLRGVSRVIQASIRNVDMAARYGGEEFAVILPETSSQRAIVVAERIRDQIAQKSFSKSLGDEEFFTTVSIGISAYPEDGLTREDLISKSDQALYFAKEQGRNRVYKYDDALRAMAERKVQACSEMTEESRLNVIRDLAAVIDAKNVFGGGGSEESVKHAVALAKKLELPEREIDSVRLAMLLHDIGAVSIPNKIINKPAPLTPEERRIVQDHPNLGAMLLQKAGQLEDIIPAILYHHEQYDGKGYPNGLKGEDIPVSARIIALVEAYQAMISDRSYRQRLSKEAALEELKKNAGTQFDP